VPRSKSSQKEARIAERRQLHNKSIRSQCKTNITRGERLIFWSELESAQGAAATAITSLDKAAGKGILHPNNAARRKSRLAKKLNQAQTSASAKPEQDKPADSPQE
jgi:small subunit ribosomal protein S20